jgi:hypothetical protein
MKIALLEDRIERMVQFSEIDITKETLIEIITASQLLKFLKAIDNKDITILHQYDCIILHRSALTNLQRDIIKNYCFDTKKPLVYFSGGISSSIYNDSTFQFLHINSKDLYSSNLRLFIEETILKNEINLLVLQFGIRWKLNLLLSIRNSVNLGIQNQSIKRIMNLNISHFIKKELILNFNLDWLSQSEITAIDKEQILNFKSKIDELIVSSI